jgi:hypothetical protein
MLGRRVAVLVDETREAGIHSVRWNAGDAASGVYIYQLQTGDFLESRKMILIR